MKIVIVNYGSGNLRSVQKGFERVGAISEISDNPQIISDATHVVVPGVGAFSECMKNLERLHLIKPILGGIQAGKPYLGICLGLQILFSTSEEVAKATADGPRTYAAVGMGIIAGKVVRFARGGDKVPHMGWNRIKIEQKNPLFDGIPDHRFFYFVHSYYGRPEAPDWIAATTEHGIPFPSAVARGNLFACQFHPEKSQSAGLRLLANFTKRR